MSKSILQQFSWLSLEKLIKTLANIGILYILARNYGPEGMGAVAIVFAYHSMWVLVTNFGQQDLVLKDASREEKLLNELFFRAVIVRLSVLVLLFPLYLVVLFFIYGKTDTFDYLILLSVIPFFLFSNLLDACFYAVREAGRVVAVQVASLLVFSACRLFLLVHNYPLYNYFLTYLMESVFYLTIISCLFFSRYKTSNISFAWFVFPLEKIKNALPIVLAGLAIMAFTKLDQVMLAHMISESEAGIYNAAARLSEYWLILPGLIVMAHFPSLAASKDSVETELGFQVVYDIATRVFLISLVLVLIFADLMVDLLYGKLFYESASVLRIHFVCVGFMVYRIITGKYLLIVDKLNLILIRSVLALVINLVLNALFIPVGGAQAAAITSVVTLVFIGLASDVFVPELRKHARMKFASYFRIFDPLMRVLVKR